MLIAWSLRTQGKAQALKLQLGHRAGGRGQWGDAVAVGTSEPTGNY